MYPERNQLNNHIFNQTLNTTLFTPCHYPGSHCWTCCDAACCTLIFRCMQTRSHWNNRSLTQTTIYTCFRLHYKEDSHSSKLFAWPMTINIPLIFPSTNRRAYSGSPTLPPSFIHSAIFWKRLELRYASLLWFLQVGVFPLLTRNLGFSFEHASQRQPCKLLA